MSDLIFSLTGMLVENGYRLTEARQVIIETLVGCGGHVSADDLAEQVHGRAPRVGRMTVYRTLDLLCTLGAIRPIYQGTAAAHYIVMHEGSHHHLICSRCGQVFEFEECAGEEMVQELSERFNFVIHSHLLEFHGLCENCQS
ncbi:MAG: transcriptional repressor [Ardenticatenaceae bacterium]|nr:transcriptional repressor [Ardenticatenaceae bacterium]MCB8991380.1 transcriptional repressor [Ardenticatenaceae bacterium]MCB9003810.1 transcriptional repressor [Ardenticatenaceae bacterium]